MPRPKKQPEAPVHEPVQMPEPDPVGGALRMADQVLANAEDELATIGRRLIEVELAGGDRRKALAAVAAVVLVLGARIAAMATKLEDARRIVREEREEAPPEVVAPKRKPRAKAETFVNVAGDKPAVEVFEDGKKVPQVKGGES